MQQWKLGWLTVVLGVTAVLPGWAAEPVAKFSQTGLQGWDSKEFAGQTRYQVVQDEQLQVIKAVARASASGQFHEVDVDLRKTPYLNWRWKVAGTLANRAEQTKAGDDYPARIYVVYDGGMLVWQTKALNYVWSSHQPRGAAWANAYTDQAQMLVVRTGAADAGQWQTERRNVRQDFKRLFKTDVKKIHAVAIMTDTDNTGAEATAWYGDIWFSD